MKRSWLWISLATLLLLALVVIATFPAALAWRWWGDRVPDVRLSSLSGSVWNGQALRVAVRGQALGKLKWQVSPWSLLGGNPAATLTLDGPGLKLSGVFAAAAERQVRISGLEAQAEAGWLAPALAIPALEPTGMLNVSGASLLLSATGMPREIDARIEWREAGVRGQVVARLGTMVIEAHGRDGRIDATVADQGDGEVEVRGQVRLDQGQYRGETVLVPRASEGPVVEALQWVGEPRPEGGRLLIVEGRIAVPEETL